MNTAQIRCSCGEVYFTRVDYYSKTTDPPILCEKAHSACPNCDFLYTKEEYATAKHRIITITKEKD